MRNPLTNHIDTVGNVLRDLADHEICPDLKHKMEEAAEYIDYLETLVHMFYPEQ